MTFQKPLPTFKTFSTPADISMWVAVLKRT